MSSIMSNTKPNLIDSLKAETFTVIDNNALEKSDRKIVLDSCKYDAKRGTVTGRYNGSFITLENITESEWENRKCID
jgi:hypothetical protein